MFSFGKGTLIASLLMLLIVFLLFLWEWFVHALHKHTPKSILPSVEYSLSEIGGLGFIGLLLELGRVHEILGQDYGEILELFQFLHIVFFKVAIGYFFYSAIMVYGVLAQIQDARQAEMMENLPNGKPFTPAQLTSPTTSVWKELWKTKHERSQEFLVRRHIFLHKYQLPLDFHAEVTPLLAHYLETLIHFSPFIWLPLVPIIAMGEAIDMTHESIDSYSEHANEATGYFYATNVFWWFVVVWQITTLALGVFNFVTLVRYKNRGIVSDNVRYAATNDYSVSTDSTELVRLSVSADSTDSDEIVPEWHLKLIQFHSWLAMSFSVLVTTEVLARDTKVLFGWTEAGDPHHVVAETLWYSGFVLLNIFQLFLTPKIFWSFCMANFDKDDVTKEAIQKQLGERNYGR